MYELTETVASLYFSHVIPEAYLEPSRKSMMVLCFENRERVLAFNYFRKKLHSKYACEFEYHFKKYKNCFVVSTEIQTIRELSSLHLNAKTCLV